MTIEQEGVVDIVSIDETQTQISLFISDHLEWDDENKKLLVLQGKINAYLAYIETGQIYDQHPQAKNLSIAIVLICKYRPNDIALKFFHDVKLVIDNAGFLFQWRIASE